MGLSFSGRSRGIRSIAWKPVDCWLRAKLLKQELGAVASIVLTQTLSSPQIVGQLLGDSFLELFGTRKLDQ